MCLENKSLAIAKRLAFAQGAYDITRMTSSDTPMCAGGHAFSQHSRQAGQGTARCFHRSRLPQHSQFAARHCRCGSAKRAVSGIHDEYCSGAAQRPACPPQRPGLGLVFWQSLGLLASAAGM